MLRSSELAAWLTAALPAETAPIKAGPLSGIVEEPDRLVSVVRQGGRAPDDEGSLYRLAFRFQVRGAQRNHDDAELLADEVDEALLRAQMPTTIGAWRVIAIGALGRPSLTAIDSAERSILDCSYEVTLPHVQ